MTKKIAVMAVLAAFFGLGVGNCKGKAAAGPAGGEPYYAVALTTGSLFFAHLKGEDAQYLYLSDVHYFQRSAPDPSDKKGGAPNLTLVRQASDLYAPKDELKLSRNQLLYYQELREDSPVVKSIAQQAQQAQQAPKP